MNRHVNLLADEILFRYVAYMYLTYKVNKKKDKSSQIEINRENI